jgi:ectoine hydroxylase-related dioxygenase (phytanoyl-CoA dioxygenase family)
MMTRDEWSPITFKDAIREDGFCLVQNLLDDEVLNSLRKHAAFSIDKESAYHGTTNYRDYGAVQCCPMYDGPFLDLLENRSLIEPMNLVMGEGCIIWSYITTSLPPGSPNFTTRIHVDRPRLFPNYCESAGSLILLDDFTEENGATWYLPKSHVRADEPTEEEFYATAKRLIAPAGSVFFFNLRLWHAGGFNRTDKWRHALSVGFVRPYIKQKFDLPKVLSQQGIDTSTLSDYVKQKLGFFAIPPASLDEYWGPEEKRTYREKSEWILAKQGL